MAGFAEVEEPQKKSWVIPGLMFFAVFMGIVYVGLRYIMATSFEQENVTVTYVQAADSRPKLPVETGMEAVKTLEYFGKMADRYYSQTHLDTEKGGFFTHQYPVALNPVFIGPEKIEEIGVQNNPGAIAFNEGIWKMLDFAIQEPFYFTYSYISDGRQFVIKAYGSLNEDCDSVFVLRGDEGVNTRVFHESSSRDCSPPRLPEL